MEVFKDFGFEPSFFFAQIINFLILAVIFKAFLYKPILKVLNDRKRSIEKGLKDAEAASLALEKANSKRAEIVKEATLEAEKIIDDTKKAAAELRETTTLAAKEEADKIIATAKAEALSELTKARKEAEDLALDLSRKIVDKILGEIFTKDEKAKIMARNAKRLEDLS